MIFRLGHVFCEPVRHLETHRQLSGVGCPFLCPFDLFGQLFDLLDEVLRRVVAAERRKPDAVGVDTVYLRERVDRLGSDASSRLRVLKPLRLRCFENVSFELLHDVERLSHDGVVVARDVDVGRRHPRLLQGVKHLVLPEKTV